MAPPGKLMWSPARRHHFQESPCEVANPERDLRKLILGSRKWREVRIELLIELSGDQVEAAFDSSLSDSGTFFEEREHRFLPTDLPFRHLYAHGAKVAFLKTQAIRGLWESLWPESMTVDGDLSVVSWCLTIRPWKSRVEVRSGSH